MLTDNLCFPLVDLSSFKEHGNKKKKRHKKISNKSNKGQKLQQIDVLADMMDQLINHLETMEEKGTPENYPHLGSRGARGGFVHLARLISERVCSHSLLLVWSLDNNFVAFPMFIPPSSFSLAHSLYRILLIP